MHEMIKKKKDSIEAMQEIRAAVFVKSRAGEQDESDQSMDEMVVAPGRQDALGRMGVARSAVTIRIQCQTRTWRGFLPALAV
jgi:hypothetical protein